MVKSGSVHIRPVILSGGAGTRLWPISRRLHPKQFVPLVGDGSLFSATLERVSDRSRYLPPIIVGNSEHKFFILENLEQQGISDALVLLEPTGRNTAAAAIVAALRAGEENELHLVMPSDHLVSQPEAFHAAVQNAAEVASQGLFTLFGITPDRPETGYGYILPGGAIDGGPVRQIARFHEKPDAKGADTLIAQGALWNSGIFLYSPAALCDEASSSEPEHFAACQAAIREGKQENQCLNLGREAYEGMRSHAFDTLVMERTRRGAVLPCSMGWSDIGSWQALWELAVKDERGNAKIGPVVARDVDDCYIRSEGPTVAVLGMEGCMVVATKDVVLVAPSKRSQEIKDLLQKVERGNAEVANAHTCVPRPWGTYENIGHGPNFQVKHIVVKPGRSLSSQMHHHRAEHWIVVAGTARVECDGMEKLVFPNQSVFIPQGATHRLSNPGKIDLQLIEVQSGDYLKEDDIVRFDDLYGRAENASGK